jgi:alkylation response protein AidB-like acyl-CoA dehydrogenase
METMATASGDRWVLNGTKQFVVAGASADLILVAASGPVGPSLFAVDGDAAGVTRELLPVLDATRPMARLTFNQTDAVLVGQAGGAADVLPALLDVASVALAAEQVGGAQACLEMAVEYAGSRVQFGRPIGSFQAIKHKCADMFADVESSRAIVQHAAWSLDAALPEAPLLARLVGAYVSDAYCRVASQNLQVHGGIGYTWEHDAQLYFKRAAASAQLLGSPTQHREQAAAMVGL